MTLYQQKRATGEDAYIQWQEILGRKQW